MSLVLIKSSRMKAILSGMYHIFMIILIITNLFFFLYNWYDLQIVIDDISLVITFVGFLFAFAGINIYSIFNTNIEEEKQRLNKVYDFYKNEIDETMKLLDYSKKLISYFQYAQMIVSVKQYNSQSLEQISSINNIVEEYKIFLADLYKRNNHKLYEQYKRDFVDVSRGIRLSLNNFYNNGALPSKFFQDINSSIQTQYRDQLNQLLEIMEGLENYDYTGITLVNEGKNKNFKERWTDFVDAFSHLLKG